MASVHYLRDLQTSFFNKTFIKNGSHNTIHIFKNYFITVFSIVNKINGIQTDRNHEMNGLLVDLLFTVYNNFGLKKRLKRARYRI